MQENEQLVLLINKDLGDPEENLLIPLDGLDRDMIREKLAVMIAYLIEHNLGRLCQAMYRLDVSETRFDRAMNENPFEEIPYAVADLVIEREILKMKTRLMYKKGEL